MSLAEPRREITTLLTTLRNYLEQEYHERLDRVILFGSEAHRSGSKLDSAKIL